MKYILKTTSSILPITEEEVPKVITAMDKKVIVVLKSGVVSGAYIISIERDIHAERGLNYGYKIQGGDNVSRADYITEIPEKLKEYRMLIDKNIKLLE